MDLTEFLRARLDEDEAVANAAGGDTWHGDSEGLYHEDVRNYPGSFGTGTYGAFLDNEDAHIIRHGPARVLREVTAKRAIIELAAEASGLDDQVDAEFRVGLRDLDAEPYVGDRILRALAAVYSDHPGYQQEWKP